MAISIRGTTYPYSDSRPSSCRGPHTVAIRAEDVQPGVRLYCIECGEFGATIEPAGEGSDGVTAQPMDGRAEP